MINEEVSKKVEEVARKGKNSIIFYKPLMLLVGLDNNNPGDRKRISKILEKISKKEFFEGKPLITAVVVHKHDKLPGKGFFSLAREIGLLTTQSNMEFWSKEIKKVWEYWSKN